MQKQLLTLSIVVAVLIRTDAAVTCCRDDGACGNTYEASSFKSCCFGEGVCFLLGSEFEGCEPCVVFGWLSGQRDEDTSSNDLTIMESTTSTVIQLGFAKGEPLPGAVYSISTMVTTMDGTAVNGVDFTVDSFQCTIMTAENTPCNISIHAIEDDITDPNEEFTLTLQAMPSDMNVVNFDSDGTYIIDQLNVVIAGRPSTETPQTTVHVPLSVTVVLSVVIAVLIVAMVIINAAWCYVYSRKGTSQAAMSNVEMRAQEVPVYEDMSELPQPTGGCEIHTEKNQAYGPVKRSQLTYEESVAV